MNQYEWAVQRYLTLRGLRFARVDDLVRARTLDGSRKNFDFLVEHPHSLGRAGLLLEVKGRQFKPGGGAWENWVTRDDLESLEHWAQHFGRGFEPLIVFAYRPVEPKLVPSQPWTPIDVEADRFGLVGVPLFSYRAHCRLRSRRWQTYMVPKATFLRLARPLVELLPAPAYAFISGATNSVGARNSLAWQAEIEAWLGRIGLGAGAEAELVDGATRTSVA